LLHPISVVDITPYKGEERYRIVAGARRFEAMKLLHWEKIPVKIIARDSSGHTAEQLLENIARQNLTTWELARGLHRAKREGHTVKQLVAATGLSKSHVENLLRVARQICPEIQRALDKGAEYRDKTLSAELLIRWAALAPEAQRRAWKEWLGTSDLVPQGRTKRRRVTVDKVRRLADELRDAGIDDSALRYLLGQAPHPLGRNRPR
jgi:ParB/RepB/Spo0J family partition protein